MSEALRPFALERFFARYEFTTRYVLCASDAETMPLRELLALEPDAGERLAELRLGYQDMRGTLELREAIAALYEAIGTDHVLAHAGSQEPIFAFMHAVLGAGDNIVVQFPAYQSQYTVAESIGATVTRWSADLDNGGAPDFDRLESLIRPETRAIVVTTPNNPTGYQFTPEQLAFVVTIARKRNLWLFGDEVYRGTEREAERLPAVADCYERGVSLGGTAKAYGLPGLRIGWVAATDASLLDRMAAIKDYLSICNGAPSELLAALALRHGERLTRRVRQITAANLVLLDAFFARHDAIFAWKRPPAGTTAFPRFLGGGSEAFCISAIEESGVLLAPSVLFDAGDAHVRVGYGRMDLPAALAALSDGVFA